MTAPLSHDLIGARVTAKAQRGQLRDALPGDASAIIRAVWVDSSGYLCAAVQGESTGGLVTVYLHNVRVIDDKPAPACEHEKVMSRATYDGQARLWCPVCEEFSQ